MDLWKKIVLIVLASFFLMASVGMLIAGGMFMDVLVFVFGMIGGSLLFAFFASLCIAPFGTISRNKKRQLQYQKTALEIFNKKYYVEKTGNYPAVLDVNENMNLPDTIKSIDNCFEERNAIIANTKLIKYKNVFANYAKLRVFYDILISYRADNFKEAMQMIKSDLDENKKIEKANQQIALQMDTIRTIKEEKAELKKYIDDMKSDMTKQMMRLDNRISSTTPTTVVNMRSLHIG